jgi:predicted permease
VKIDRIASALARLPHKLLMRVQMLFRRSRAGTRLNDELQFHLEQQITENLAAGMNPEEARRAALRSFGNPTTLRDQTRETWSWDWLEVLVLDIRQSIRALTRTPSFSIIAVLVLALGIGANVALFSVVHSVLLRSLPFRDPDRLVRVYEADSKRHFQDNIVSGGTFNSWKEQAKSFEELAIKKWAGYNLSGQGGQLPEFVEAATGSWNLFPTLGIEPALGRLFGPDDDRLGANATVVLTWGLWKRRYGGDPGILGQTILLDSKPYTVIGVLPAWFSYPEAKTQLWTPVYHETPALLMNLHQAHRFDVIGRLKPGVSVAQATSEMNTIQQQIRRQYPDGPVFDAANIRPILDADVRNVSQGLYSLFAATGCLLLIACLNISNLLIARAAARRRETAIRTALGSSRLRLLRGLVIESLLLSTAGGAIGLALAYAALRWLVSTRDDLPRAEAIHIDGVALLFAVGIVVVCGFVAGLIPAMSFRDRQILGALQESSRSVSGGEGRVRLRRWLLSLEVGLTVVLLIGAGLLLRTYHQLRSVDLGCATSNVLSMGINLPWGTYDTPAKRVSFFEQLLEKTRSLPGVESAGLTTALPGTGHQRDDTFSIAEHPPVAQGEFLDESTYFVDPGYFTALQIPLIRGRFLLPDERFDRANSVVVNQAFVRKYFPNEDPIGKHIVTTTDRGKESRAIVGVVGDTHEEISEAPRGHIYFPLYGGTEQGASLVVRAGDDPASLALPVQHVVSSIDRDQSVSNVLTMDQVIGQSTREASFNAALISAFAIVSLVLAAVGLFGVLSYIVAQRTTEIGIRIALGARREQVIRLLLRDGLMPAFVGLVLGLAASAAVTRLIKSMLYHTGALDPVVFFAVSAMLLLTACLACAVPAWRASRLDPMQALRNE